MKKFELTGEFIVFLGKQLFRIKSLIDFGDVKCGEVGGFLEKEENLSQEGSAWVSGNAKVSGDAQVSGNARVSGDARVSGNARVSGDAQVSGNAWVSGDAWVSGNAWVSGDAWVSGNAKVSGDAQVYGNADYACVKGFGRVCRNTTFFRTKDGGVSVACGCFHGTMQEFREKVKETHGESKMAKEYLMIADLMEMHFDKET